MRIQNKSKLTWIGPPIKWTVWYWSWWQWQWWWWWFLALLSKLPTSKLPNSSSSGSRWARTKTKTLLESNGQNLIGWKDRTGWSRKSFKKMTHFDHYPVPGESDSCMPLNLWSRFLLRRGRLGVVQEVLVDLKTLCSCSFLGVDDLLWEYAQKLTIWLGKLIS